MINWNTYFPPRITEDIDIELILVSFLLYLSLQINFLAASWNSLYLNEYKNGFTQQLQKLANTVTW